MNVRNKYVILVKRASLVCMYLERDTKSVTVKTTIIVYKDHVHTCSDHCKVFHIDHLGDTYIRTYVLLNFCMYKNHLSAKNTIT